MSETKPAQVLYFGCIGEAGHYLWNHRGRQTTDWASIQPWGEEVDGGLAPQDNGERQGEALLHHKGGWTAIAFWDRSVDSRPGSNSAFLVDREVGFDVAVTLAKTNFPAVWARFGFEVRQKGEGAAR